MSVPKGKRKPSPTDFLYYAREIRILTLQKYKSAISKTHRFTIGLPLCETAREVYNLVKEGNSYYPKNKHEAQIRRDKFLSAYAKLQSFISDLEVAQEVIGFDEDHLKDWMELVSVELTRIKGILESDAKRFANLP